MFLSIKISDNEIISNNPSQRSRIFSYSHTVFTSRVMIRMSWPLAGLKNYSEVFWKVSIFRNAVSGNKNNRFWICNRSLQASDIWTVSSWTPICWFNIKWRSKTLLQNRNCEMGNEFVRTIIQFAFEILVDSGSKFIKV